MHRALGTILGTEERAVGIAAVLDGLGGPHILE